MSGKNPTAGKLYIFFHQIEDRVFSLVADDGQVTQVDDEFATVQILACISASSAKLHNPWSDEGSLNDQFAL